MPPGANSRAAPAPYSATTSTGPAAGYFGYWGEQAGPKGKGYYSFDLGGWHLVALNSNIELEARSAQVTWLREDLARSGAPCKLAFFHHPVFSSGEHGGTPELGGIFKVLYDARVSLGRMGAYIADALVQRE